MNDQRIAQLRQEQQTLSAKYREIEDQLRTVGGRLVQIDAEIRAAASSDTRAIVIDAMHQRRVAAHEEEARIRAENATSHAAWMQLQRNGETDEARQERLRLQQARIDAENERERREEENRRRRLAELRARGFTAYE